MSQPNKPSEKGFKPGANMPHDGYDPATQGMSESGNHAVGIAANDTPHVNAQHGRQPARSEQSLREGSLSRSYQDSKQRAADAAAETTHRDRSAGARGDSYSDSKR